MAGSRPSTVTEVVEPAAAVAFAVWSPGEAVTSIVATLSTADLARAAQHNRTTFSLLTESPTNVPVAQLQTAAQNAHNCAGRKEP